MRRVKLKVIPAVDVLDGKVVRLLQGSYDRVTIYGEDPVAMAATWIEKGAPMVHVVDLAGARSGRPDGLLWERLARAEIAFQVGGGIRDGEQARRALDAGAVRVVLGTAAVWRPRVLVEVGQPERVLAAIDVSNGMARGEGWTDQGRNLTDVVSFLAAARIAGVVLTAIARDGTLEGPDLSLIGLVRDLAPTLNITASGGVGELSHLAALSRAGCEAAIVGRALYEKRFTLEEAMTVA
ncbi:MAG: HisA/HisF-related TIM barrel protein [Acidimicrobiia bacterium]